MGQMVHRLPALEAKWVLMKSAAGAEVAEAGLQAGGCHPGLGSGMVRMGGTSQLCAGP